MLSFTTLNVLNVPEVTDCVQVKQNLHVKLLYKGSPLPLPWWFRHGRDCDLTRKSMMQNLPNYVRLEVEQTFNILEELKELKFKTKRTFLSKCYSIFFSFTLYFLTNIPIINERVSISLLVSTKKNH